MSGTRLLVAIVSLSVTMVRLPAQETNDRATQGGVFVAKLAPLLYPPLAKQTRIVGDVQLALVIRADGSIESASVVSGHPLLKQAALDSAEHSQFVCKECDKAPRALQMTYSFKLGPTAYCAESSLPTKPNEQEESYPRLVQAENHITLYDRPVGTCDLAFKIVETKARSIKCMYLWKCGVADWHEEPLNKSH
jgi:TonB family protein